MVTQPPLPPRGPLVRGLSWPPSYSSLQNLHSYRADWPHPCFPLKPHEKRKVILLLKHRNTKTEKEPLEQQSRHSLLTED